MCVIIRERLHMENEEAANAKRTPGTTSYGDTEPGPLFTPDEYAMTEEDARNPAYEVR